MVHVDDSDQRAHPLDPLDRGDAIIDHDIAQRTPC
jgi:hypothetical protein